MKYEKEFIESVDKEKFILKVINNNDDITNVTANKAFYNLRKILNEKIDNEKIIRKLYNTLSRINNEIDMLLNNEKIKELATFGYIKSNPSVKIKPIKPIIEKVKKKTKKSKIKKDKVIEEDVEEVMEDNDYINDDDVIEEDLEEDLEDDDIKKPIIYMIGDNIANRKKKKLTLSEKIDMNAKTGKPNSIKMLQIMQLKEKNFDITEEYLVRNFFSSEEIQWLKKMKIVE
jgi:hypothetical protein